MAAAVILAAGTAISVYGQMQQAKAQSDAANKDASAKQAMAQEVLDRQQFNKETLTRQGDIMVGNQASQYAAGNVDVGSGSPLAAMENTLAATRRKIHIDDQEANFRAQQYLIGATSEQEFASQSQQAGNIRAGGTILTAASSAYLNYSSGPKTPSAGGIPLGTEGSTDSRYVGSDYGSFGNTA